MPRVDRITIRGFKSIQALDDFELRPLTALIGPNGSGKSNLLAAFRMLSSLAQGRFRLFVRKEDGPDALPFGGRKRTAAIYARVVLDGGRCRYELTAEPAGDTLVIRSERLDASVLRGEEECSSGTMSGAAATYEGPGGDIESLLSNEFPPDAFPTRLVPEIQGWRVFHFQDTSREAPVRHSVPVRDNLCLRENGGNLAPFLRHLKERYLENHRRIVEAVRLAAPFLDDFVHRNDAGERMELEWFHRDVGRDTPFGPRQLSDGTLRYICLATLLNQPEHLQPAPIIVDEPELGLHPSALALLAEMLEQASSKRQIIVSTQSADLVSELALEDIVTIERRDGESFFERLNGDRLAEWLEEYTLGDLWRMNVVGGRSR